MRCNVFFTVALERKSSLVNLATTTLICSKSVCNTNLLRSHTIFELVRVEVNNTVLYQLSLK